MESFGRQGTAAGNGDQAPLPSGCSVFLKCVQDITLYLGDLLCVPLTKIKYVK